MSYFGLNEPASPDSSISPYFIGNESQPFINSPVRSPDSSPEFRLPGNGFPSPSSSPAILFPGNAFGSPSLSSTAAFLPRTEFRSPQLHLTTKRRRSRTQQRQQRGLLPRLWDMTCGAVINQSFAQKRLFREPRKKLLLPITDKEEEEAALQRQLQHERTSYSILPQELSPLSKIFQEARSMLPSSPQPSQQQQNQWEPFNVNIYTNQQHRWDPFDEDDDDEANSNPQHQLRQFAQGLTFTPAPAAASSTATPSTPSP